MLNKIKILLLISFSLLIIASIGCNDKNNSLTDPSSDEYLNKQLEEMEIEHNADLERLIEYLQLTDVQIEQIKLFFEEQRIDLRNQFSKYRNKGKRRIGFDYEKFRGMREEKRKEFHEFLITILTDEQKTKFEEMQLREKEEHLTAWISKLTEELELSDEQVIKVTEIFEKQVEKMREIHEGDFTREEIFELIKSLKDEMKLELDRILSAEQIEILEELIRKGKVGFGPFGHFGEWRP